MSGKTNAGTPALECLCSKFTDSLKQGYREHALRPIFKPLRKAFSRGIVQEVKIRVKTHTFLRAAEKTRLQSLSVLISLRP